MKKLNLGKELSKNAQKKVIGGAATITCKKRYWPYDEVEFTSSWLNCGMAVAYCNGQQMDYVSCESGGGPPV